MQATTEVHVYNHIEFIYELLHRTLVHVLADSTRPRRQVGQGPHSLVGGRQSGRERSIDISGHAPKRPGTPPIFRRVI